MIVNIHIYKDAITHETKQTLRTFYCKNDIILFGFVSFVNHKLLFDNLR